MQRVEVTLPSRRIVTVDYGTRVSEIFATEPELSSPSSVVGAFVNHEVVSLSFKVEVNATIEPIRLGTTEGARIYRRSLCFLLTIAAEELFPDRRLVIGHSLGEGYFYYFDGYDEVPETDLDSLAGRMREIVARNQPIERRVLSYGDAITHLEEVGHTAALKLLMHRNESKVPIYVCGEYRDISHGPLVASTGLLAHFEIIAHSPGFLLRYPPSDEASRLKPFVEQPVVFAIFREYKQWGKVLGISSAGELNETIRDGHIEEFIRVVEALHHRKIASIADAIADAGRNIRVVLIAGPSSSGKTTFTKKLAIQLKVLGYKPIAIGTDDYYLPRELTPRDESGDFDFESIDAIDREFLTRNLLELSERGITELPVFDFKLGGRRAETHRLELDERGVVLIEGIHGLNPLLTERTDPALVFRIYISALTQLNIDDHNRIPTTDVRLLRRMVRDHQFRGYSALETLRRWPSVRRGEKRNIFPFEKHADVAINSSLDYELPVLKGFAEPLLRTIKPFDESYSEAVRLSQFLSNFIMISPTLVPPDSILREFIGESSFRY